MSIDNHSTQEMEPNKKVENRKATLDTKALANEVTKTATDANTTTIKKN